MNYILKNGVPVSEPNIIVYADWWETADRNVKKTTCGEGIEVSTVFLGTDLSFGDSKLPVLWETMVFGGKLDEEQDRYTLLEDAEAGHDAMVARVNEAEKLEERDED